MATTNDKINQLNDNLDELNEHELDEVSGGVGIFGNDTPPSIPTL